MRKKLLFKLLSILLAIATLLSLLPVSVFGAQEVTSAVMPERGITQPLDLGTDIMTPAESAIYVLYTPKVNEPIDEGEYLIIAETDSGYSAMDLSKIETSGVASTVPVTIDNDFVFGATDDMCIEISQAATDRYHLRTSRGYIRHATTGSRLKHLPEATTVS